MLGEIDALFSLIGRSRKLWTYFKNKPVAREEDSLAKRFILLFEKHGIHRNQIPRFFGHGLTVADVSDDVKLLNVLSEEMIQGAVDLFAINREWLDGVDSHIYDVHDFYKDPSAFEQFISEVLTGAESVHGDVYRCKSSKHEYDAIIVIEEQIGWISERPIFRYHLCGNWIFNYWKCRAFLAACVALAWKSNIYLYGKALSAEALSSLIEGRSFVSDAVEGELSLADSVWHPEELAECPNTYIAGLDEGVFGEVSALKLWLFLNKNGYMDTGNPGVIDRSAFECKLKELQSIE